MITNLYIKNFKSLKEVNLELRPLNLLTGLNGSGKSSLIQVLLLLRQNKITIQEGKLLLKMQESDKPLELFNAGVAEDVYYDQATEGKISFHFKFSDSAQLKWDFQYLRDKNNTDDFLQGARQYKLKELEKYNIFNQHFQYFFAERISSRDSYPASNDNVLQKKTLGVYGEHTAFFLQTYGLSHKITLPALQHPKAKTEQLLYQVDAWLSEISPNVSITTELTKNKEEVELRFQYGVRKYKPKNVGFGLSYVLPVVTALLTAEAGKLIIIENPESHIHPRGQAELGRLIAAAAQTGAQLIIETHSDHILNGIRVAVKQNPAIKDLVNIFFFDSVEKNEEHYSEITAITVNRHGDLSDYPDNFLDEWSNQLLNLV